MRRNPNHESIDDPITLIKERLTVLLLKGKMPGFSNEAKQVKTNSSSSKKGKLCEVCRRDNHHSS